MKKSKLIMLTLISATFIMGCSNTSSEKAKEQTVTSVHEEEQQDEESEELKLNNGQKWIVNEEMKPHILESETVLDEYIKAESNDYTTLAAQLKEKNSELIKSCTMKGASHDELHKWLHPHMELIKALGNARDPKEAAVIISKLEKSFETYHNYFI